MWNVLDILQSLVVLLLPLLTFKILKFARTYYQWCQLTRNNNIGRIGPFHPIWGSFHLVRYVILIYVLKIQ